jgi:glycine oxidase
LIDVLIVGQGLAGSWLALNCRNAGLTTIIVDNHHASSSTRIAAGIINPLVGPRLSPLATTVRQYEELVKLYVSTELMTQKKLIDRQTLVRFLNTAREQFHFDQNKNHPTIQPWIHATPNWTPIFNVGAIQFESHGVARINAPQWLNAMKEYFLANGMLIQRNLNYDCITYSATGVEWQGIVAKVMVFCEGAAGCHNPFFSYLHFKNAMGHCLKLSSPHIPESTMFNNGHWLAPSGKKQFMYGATSYWCPSQTAASKATLLTQLAQFIKVPVTVNCLVHGVRPCLVNRKPCAEFSPHYPRLAIINGLRGQGFFEAPTLTHNFVKNHLQQKLLTLAR